MKIIPHWKITGSKRLIYVLIFTTKFSQPTWYIHILLATCNGSKRRFVIYFKSYFWVHFLSKTMSISTSSPLFFQDGSEYLSMRSAAMVSFSQKAFSFHFYNDRYHIRVTSHPSTTAKTFHFRFNHLETLTFVHFICSLFFFVICPRGK